jgi:hypothetical protein
MKTIRIIVEFGTYSLFSLPTPVVPVEACATHNIYIMFEFSYKLVCSNGILFV